MKDPRSLLRIPSIYNTWQRLVGAPAAWRMIASQYLRLSDGQRVIDLGCGTSNILQYLPIVEYIGVDFNHDYLDAARARYSKPPLKRQRCKWICDDICASSAHFSEQADLVMAVGVLHHLDDDGVPQLLRNARALLRPGGRFVSIDPSFTANQSRLARTIIRCDRGQFVRDHDEYVRLVRDTFASANASHHADLLRIPFSMTILDGCRDTVAGAMENDATRVQAA